MSALESAPLKTPFILDPIVPPVPPEKRKKTPLFTRRTSQTFVASLQVD